jgi:glycosyltransferase involved in cell wall biosynthesis
MPEVSVVIPTLNEENVVTGVLDDLRAQTVRPSEVVVVDAASTDRTAEQVGRYPEVRLLRAAPPVGAQRTLGGREARGDVLVFLDADVRLPADFLERLVGAFASRRLAVGCPWYWPHRSTAAITAVFAWFGALFFLLQKLVPCGAGPCIVTTRAAFERAGGFRPELTFDDIAFVRRAARGARFAVLPVRVFVSDRRFRRYGTPRVLLTYLALSPFFTLSLFGAANIIKYPFGDYRGIDRK